MLLGYARVVRSGSGDGCCPALAWAVVSAAATHAHTCARQNVIMGANANSLFTRSRVRGSDARVYYACACTRVCTIAIKVGVVSCARHPCDALEHACAVPRRARAATYTALCTVRGASWSPAVPPPDAVFLPSRNAVKAAATASTTCQGAGWWRVGSRANIPKKGVHNTCASSSDQLRSSAACARAA